MAELMTICRRPAFRYSESSVNGTLVLDFSPIVLESSSARFDDLPLETKQDFKTLKSLLKNDRNPFLPSNSRHKLNAADRNNPNLDIITNLQTGQSHPPIQFYLLA